MPTEVILPKVDMDMATGRISKWLVAEGTVVKQGDPIFEIETDKAAMEVEAPASGTLGNILAQEGADVPVGNPVAWIYAAGEAVVAPQKEAAAQAVKQPTEAAPVAQAAVTVEHTAQSPAIYAPLLLPSVWHERPVFNFRRSKAAVHMAEL